MIWRNRGSAFLAAIQNKSSREHHSEWSTEEAASCFGAAFLQLKWVFSFFTQGVTQQTSLAPNLQVSNEKCHILARTQRMQPNETNRGFTRRSFGKAQTGIWLNIWGCLTLHRHSQCACTGEAPTVWQIWSISAEKSGQISSSQDVLCW